MAYRSEQPLRSGPKIVVDVFAGPVLNVHGKMLRIGTATLLGLIVIPTVLACNRDQTSNTIRPDVAPSVSPSATSSAPDAGPISPAPREFVPAKDITNDDNYVWKEGSGYRITLLFDQYGRSKNKGRPNLIANKNEPVWDSAERMMVNFGEQLFDGLHPCRTSAGDIELEYLALTLKGAYVGYQGPAACQKETVKQRFYAEGRDYDDKRGFTFRTVQTDVKTGVGAVRITYQGTYCDDTGRHHVEIRGPRGRVILRDTLTIELFEEDLDADGTQELYLMSEQACGGWLRVVRVVAEE